MADDQVLGQDEIEKLLNQKAGGTAGADPPPAPQSSAATPAPPGLGDNPLVQEDIEKLLAQAGKTPSPASGPENASTGEDRMAEKDIDFLLKQAEQALESIAGGETEIIPSGITPFRFEEIAPASASTETASLDLVRDVDLDLKIELGQTRMYLEDVLKLRKGSVVTLDKLAGDPVDIFVNGRLIARGEVLVLNDNFCVRVAELVAGVQTTA